MKIDRWEPSSKRCNHCGHVVDKLPLSIRSWDCPSCEVKGIDRDTNAAQNIIVAGLAVLGNIAKDVCGANVSLDSHKVKEQLRKTRKGRKQKPKL